MSLLTIVNEYKELKKQLKKYKERKYFLPLSVIENPNLEGDVWCTVKDIDLAENFVELVYNDPEDHEEMVTFISIEKFDELT